MQNEFEGKTVEDAIALGLKTLGISEHEAEVDVIQRGSRGIFGIGGSTAIVRISKNRISKNDAGSIETTTALPTKSAASTVASGPTRSSSEAPASGQTPVSEQAKVEPDVESAVDNDYEEESTSGELREEEEISDDELADMAMDMLGKTISLMGYDVEITALWKDPEPGDDERCLTLDVEGENLGPLIGRRGETLDSLQYMLRLMVNQKIRAWCNIVVDVASYKSRRAEQLIQMAHRVAEQVAGSGRPESMEPMPSNERRIVHLTLRDHADVYTESTGDSDRRKVHVVPRSLTS